MRFKAVANAGCGKIESFRIVKLVDVHDKLNSGLLYVKNVNMFISVNNSAYFEKINIEF